MRPITIAIFLISCLFGCLAKKETATKIKTGIWRATIDIQGHSLPFGMEVSDHPGGGFQIYLINAQERILLDEIRLWGDSIDIVLHVFDANIKAQIIGDTLRGEFIKNYAVNYKIPFVAVYGQQDRFEKRSQLGDIPDFSGKYEVQFFDAKDTIPAIGIFHQQEGYLTGTFLTPTGDYRYLEGSVSSAGHLQLSTFDGNHAYLFNAVKTGAATLVGDYYSGKTLHQTWTAVKNENASLPDAERLTYLKEGYDRIDFEFPDITGKKYSLTDAKYKDKVIVLQLFGTWCPNCMDETTFLASWYDANKTRGVEVIGLAYERKADFSYARDRVLKMTKRYGVNYEILIAGTDDKVDASKTLPMLNEIFAFPTTIFVGTDGKVKKIHTGFAGPGTGLYYEEFVQHFNETINEMLSERQTTLN